MTMSNLHRRGGALLVALLSLFFFIPLLPAQGDTVYVRTSPFTDLSVDHWSFSSIIKLNIRGVVSGYTDGTFMPEASISQLEAVLMAVRNMNMTSQIQAMDDTAALPFTVPSWALTNNKKELLFAIQQGLIVPSENNFSADSSATRAWMTQLIIRMIGKNPEAIAVSTTSSSFSDDAFIPTWARGYVNTAIKYNLISGYTDGSFKPNNNVKRCEAVTLLNRSEGYLSISNIVKPGTLSAINGTAYSISTASSSYNFLMLDRTWSFDQTGKLIAQTNFQVGDPIKVITNTSHQALYIEKTTAAALPSSPSANTPVQSSSKVEGAVLHTIPEQNLIVVKTPDERIITRSVTSETAITDAKGLTMQLADIPIDSEVELYVNLNDELAQIKVLTYEGSTNNQGVIYQLVPAQKLIMITTATGQYITYQYNSLLEVIVPNIRFASVDDLKIGDEVKTTAVNGVLSTIELISQQVNLTDTYAVVSVNPELNLITLEKNGNLVSYYLANNATIKISGLSSGILSDLQKGDQVSVTVKDGRISLLEVLNRSASGYITGTITAIDTRARIIVIRDNSGSLVSYEVNSSAKIEIDNVSAALSELEIDDSVEISLQNDKVIYLNVLYGTEGVVNNIDYTRLLISITSDSGVQKSYIMEDDVTINKENVSRPKIRDIGRGDRVRVKLNSEGLVSEIDVESVVIYTIDTVTTGSDRLRVTNSEESRTIYLDNYVQVVVSGKTYGDIRDFNKGDQIAATFMGDELKKIELLPSATGRVTSVNAANGTFTVLDNDGNSHIFTFGSGSLLVQDGVKKSSLSLLSSGQYVQVSSEAYNQVTVNVLTRITGKFVSGNDYTIILQHNSGTTSAVNRTYNLKYDFVIYSGSTQITTSFSGIAKNSDLAIYLSDNVVVAVEKL